MAEILTGAPVAEALIQSLIPRVERLKSAGVTPRLAMIRLGEVGSQLAYQHSAQRVLKRIGAEATSFQEKYKNVGTNDVIQFQAQLDLADDDGSLKQDEVINILQAMIQEGLSYDDAYLLFHSRYDSDKNNPWRRYKP